MAYCGDCSGTRPIALRYPPPPPVDPRSRSLSVPAFRSRFCAFANISQDPSQDYFSDGLSEEMINQLAQIPGLRVTGRTSSFAFKGKNEDCA